MARMLNERHSQPQNPPKRPPPGPPPQDRFRIEWILVPLCILGMAYVLYHVKPVISWKEILSLLQVHNTERFSMLGHLCLVGILVVAAVKIFSGK